jgi:hypothetical protein
MRKKQIDEEQELEREELVVVDPCEDCPNWADLKQQRLRMARLLKRAGDGLENRLNDAKLQLTVGDYLKLMQFAKEVEKETDEEGPRELKVTWVDPLSK